MRKYLTRELIVYFIFGCLAVLVNYAVFWLALRALGEARVLLVNIIAFVAATSFAFCTNKLFVFQTRGIGRRGTLRELVLFFGARIASFGVEELGLWICADLIHVERYSLFGFSGLLIAKVFLLGVSAILNYIFSKFFIFKKK